MTVSKRMMDLILAAILGILALPVLALLLVAMAATQGRPLFYLSERMKQVDQPFTLIKLRSMRIAPDGQDFGVSGGDKRDRITPVGRFLRATRLDEIPQLWNVLRGDMSLVGPRPPLRAYVEARPDLYTQVLQCRPGITGLATLVYHRHEEWLLSACRTPQETHEVYLRRCVPTKARLDLIYRDNRNLCLDLWLLGRTVARLLSR